MTPCRGDNIYMLWKEKNLLARWVNINKINNQKHFIVRRTSTKTIVFIPYGKSCFGQQNLLWI